MTSVSLAMTSSSLVFVIVVPAPLVVLLADIIHGDMHIGINQCGYQHNKHGIITDNGIYVVTSGLASLAMSLYVALVVLVK